MISAVSADLYRDLAAVFQREANKAAGRMADYLNAQARDMLERARELDKASGVYAIACVTLDEEEDDWMGMDQLRKAVG